MPGPFLKHTIVVFVFAVLIATLYALRFESHFVPSPLGLRLALGVSTMFGIGGVILAFMRLRRPLSGDRLGPSRRWILVPVLGLFFFVLPYLAFEEGFPALYTAAFGSPGERLVTVTGWRTPFTPSVRSCEGPVVAEARFLGGNTICLSQKSAPLVRPGSKLIVRGPATAFGIKVETISLAERAAVPPSQTLPSAPLPVPPAVADPGLPVGELVDRGRKAYVDKNYSEAMRWYRMAAEQGDAAAQISVGSLYADGRGVPQNYPEAMQWFRKGADQGNPAAQDDVGSLYAKGWGAPQNYSEAMQWFRKGAEEGYPAAQNNIGSLYVNGRGVPRDYSEAMRWFQMAAAQGNAMAQSNVGWMMARGEGASKDCTAARQWFEKASAAGLDLARNHLSTGAKGACPW
jgi:tetratricopeptide (TPR) repeat protein